MAQLHSLNEALASDTDVESTREGVRHVLMDVDTVLFGLVNSELYKRVEGATCGADVRLDIYELTKFMRQDREHLQETSLNAVYNNTSPKIADVFTRAGWGVNHVTASGMHRAFVSWLEKQPQLVQDNGTTTTVALICGDGQALRALQSSPLLAQNQPSECCCSVRIEVWSWAHAMHEGVLHLMRERPQTVRVYFLDEIADRIVRHRNYFGVDATVIASFAEQAMKTLLGRGLGKAIAGEKDNEKEEEKDAIE
ncbi:hypothetical protein PINS_up004522 [Pythium insidiosum]|nr:hypothetical protein PINS_up004522 [Pythium insidiosum]